MGNKRITALFLAAAVAAVAVPAAVSTEAADEAVQMEYLDRGAVAVKTDDGVYISWRLLGTDEYDTAFDIYRGSEKIATVKDSTNYTDPAAGEEYTVVVSGEPLSSGDTVTVNDEQYFEIPLDVPEGGTSLDGEVYTYSPNDVTPADVDGDGEYELILKWEPSNSFDSGKDAKHNGNVYIDCYEMSGEKLWRIDMGININAGAHFTQMAAYDFDLDGKAELAMKTASGTVDGTGKFVSEASLINEIKETDNSADYRHSENGIDDTGGRVMSGPEFYTVFQGDTGAALDTIYYPHPRDDGHWGDTWGNRSERYLAGVAYLDGEKPSMIAWRGYYAKTTVTAYDLVDKRLVEVADFDTDDGDNYVYAGNGNHNLTVADVDGDGKDEIISGSLALDDDLTVLWCSGRGHGDALHLADYDPTHEGLEYFSVHEEYVKQNETEEQHVISGSTTGNDGKIRDGGMTLYKAENGEELFHVDSGRDTGRGMMANAGYGDGYFELWGSGNYVSYGGEDVSGGSYSPASTNQRIFWDGDTYDELLDGTGASDSGSRIAINDSKGRIATFSDVLTNNGTKNNPCLIADLFGDWREEFVARSSDNSSLFVYTTTIPTEHRLYTLMHDRTYRMQAACQNAGYNQPPHIGYYINEENNEADTRKYAAYISTVHNGEKSVRTKNTDKPGTPTDTPDPTESAAASPTPTVIPTASPTPKPTPTVMPTETVTETPVTETPSDTPVPEFLVDEFGMLTAYNGTDTEVVVPSEVNGVTVTAIGYAFANSDIVSIDLPDTVTLIIFDAFMDCSKLRRVTLSSGIRILTNAFEGCEALEYVYIPESVRFITEGTFSSCPNVVIYCEEGSIAQEYAEIYGIDYVITGGSATMAPTDAPTAEPTDMPTDAPTDEPTYAPTDAPTEEPTPVSSPGASSVPESTPTAGPSAVPTPEMTPDTSPEPTLSVTEAPGNTQKPDEGVYRYDIVSCKWSTSQAEPVIECYEESDNTYIICASYSADGKLIMLDMQPLDMKAGERRTITLKHESRYVKIFITDPETMRPYSEVYKLRISAPSGDN